MFICGSCQFYNQIDSLSSPLLFLHVNEASERNVIVEKERDNSQSSYRILDDPHSKAKVHKMLCQPRDI